jgi:hypothetical protein
MSEEKVVITLTTIPERLVSDHGSRGMESCILSLCTQDYNNYEIHLNVPTHYAMHDNKEYIIPDWIEEYVDKYPNLKIHRVKDIGPLTKIIPTIERVTDNDTLLLVVDDDIRYDPLMIKEHLIQQKKNPNCAIGYDGMGAIDPSVINDQRNHFVTMVWFDIKVKVLQHYKSVSYKRSYFEEDLFTDFLGKTASDDILISAYMGKQGISRLVPHYEKDGVYKDIDEWQKRICSHSFPMLGHTHAEPQQGTQDPKAEALYNIRFYRPPELEKYLNV